MMRTIAACLCALLLAIGAPAAAKRVALVIGNGAYAAQGGLGRLRNPANDARAMAAMLRGLDFEIVSQDGAPVIDAGVDAMDAALTRFQQAADGAEIALVFFAGHGVEAAGRNWLIPVDATIRHERRLPREAIALDDVLAAAARAETRIVLLDACREDPFRATIARLDPTRGASRGLGEMAFVSRGTLIGFAAAPGAVAQDGAGADNSPYTQALLAHLPTPGISVADAMTKVTSAVERATGFAQSPWRSGNLNTIVRLAPEAAAPPPQPPPADLATVELQDWRFAAASADAAVIESFVATYCPGGRFCAIAQARLAALGPSTAAAPPAPPAPEPPDPAQSALDAARAQEAGLSRAQRAEAQRRLTLLGHDTRGVDGVIGPRTRAALEDWQRSAGAPATGVLDDATRRRLEAASADVFAAWRAETARRRADESRQAAALDRFEGTFCGVNSLGGVMNGFRTPNSRLLFCSEVQARDGALFLRLLNDQEHNGGHVHT